MRTPKKIWRGITRKLKNRKDTTTAKEAVIEESRNSNIPEEVEVKEIANADKAAEIDTQLCKNINKIVIILIYLSLHVKPAKRLKMLQ